MDNRKMYKKIATIFWWTLTALPLILLLIVFLVGIPNYANNFDWSNNQWSNFFDYVLNNSDIYESAFNEFDNMSIPFIRDTFINVFDNIFNVPSCYPIGYLFGFMLSVQVYHLLFDCLVFFIHLIHNFMDKFNEMY